MLRFALSQCLVVWVAGLKRKKGGPLSSNCPGETWIDAMVQKDPAPGKVIVDIGCNKGDDAMQWMERWDFSPTHFWDAHKWNEVYEKLLPAGNYACPRRSTPSVMGRQKKNDAGSAAFPTGVCVEALPANEKLLQEASKSLGYGPGTTYGSLHIVHAAVLDEAQPGQMIKFQNGGPGQETAGVIVSDSGATGTQVPVQTVDGILSQLDIQRVDILTIDTEGADPAVLKGAATALKSVRYLEFEVHRDMLGTSWHDTTLQSVVKSLDAQEFECYWAGNDGKLQMLNLGCWQDEWEKTGWSNAACVKKNDVWWDALQEFVISRNCP